MSSKQYDSNLLILLRFFKNWKMDGNSAVNIILLQLMYNVLGYIEDATKAVLTYTNDEYINVESVCTLLKKKPLNHWPYWVPYFGQSYVSQMQARYLSGKRLGSRPWIPLSLLVLISTLLDGSANA